MALTSKIPRRTANADCFAHAAYNRHVPDHGRDV
jgi:hypothetical protein